MIAHCPRCREVIRRGSVWTPLAAQPGHARVFQVRHRKGDGRVCVAYVGERRRAGAAAHGRASFGASLFAAADALGRRAG